MTSLVQYTYRTKSKGKKDNRPLSSPESVKAVRRVGRGLWWEEFFLEKLGLPVLSRFLLFLAPLICTSIWNLLKCLCMTWLEGLVSKPAIEGASSEAGKQRVVVDGELLLWQRVSLAIHLDVQSSPRAPADVTNQRCRKALTDAIQLRLHQLWNSGWIQSFWGGQWPNKNGIN